MRVVSAMGDGHQPRIDQRQRRIRSVKILDDERDALARQRPRRRAALQRSNSAAAEVHSRSNHATAVSSASLRSPRGRRAIGRVDALVE